MAKNSSSAGYFIITSSEDGISIEGPLDEDGVQKRLALDSEGQNYYNTRGFHDRVPEQDKGCFMDRADERKMLLIKGEIVTPRPVEVVTKYKL